MKLDQISSTEFLQKILEERGYVAFLEFSKNVESVKEEAQKRVKAREEAQKAIEDKIAELHDLIISDGIICDQDQLKAFFLKQLDDKYSPSVALTAKTVTSETKRRKVKSKYKYQTENGEFKEWSGRGGIPLDLKNLVVRENEGIEITKNNRQELLVKYLIKEDEQ
jgi:DNA-binding protein H-NS